MQIQPSSGGSGDKGSFDVSIGGRIALLCAVGLGSFALSGINPILPQITRTFGDNPHAALIARSMVTIVGVSMAIAAPLSSLLVERFGPRLMLLAALLVYGVAGAGSYWIQDIYLLLGARVIVGIAAATTNTTIYTMILTRSDGAARDHWIGFANTSAAYSLTFLMFLVSYVAQFGWREVFLLYGVALVYLAIALVTLAPDRAPARPAAEAAPKARPGPLPWAILLGTIVIGTAAVAPLVYVPFRYRDIGLSPSEIGLAMIPVTLISASMSLFYGRVRAYLSLHAIFALSFGLIALGCLLNALAGTFWHALVAQIVFGFGDGLVFVNQFGLVAQKCGRDAQPRAIGFVTAGFCAGPMVGQFVLEPIASAYGIVAVLLSVCALAATATALNLRRARLWPKRNSVITTV